MSNNDVTRNLGRRVSETMPITIDVPTEQLEAIDRWIEEDGGRFDRAEAIRALVNHALGRTVASRGVKMLRPRLRSLDDMDESE
jgi:Arc/MetJ-type ribon-helix-helix transcriptional regulator